MRGARVHDDEEETCDPSHSSSVGGGGGVQDTRGPGRELYGPFDILLLAT